MPKFLAFELSDGTVTGPVVNVEDVVGSRVVGTNCPDCEEGDLVLQSQGHGPTYERYLECSNEDCGRCFYR